MSFVKGGTSRRDYLRAKPAVIDLALNADGVYVDPTPIDRIFISKEQAKDFLKALEEISTADFKHQHLHKPLRSELWEVEVMNKRLVKFPPKQRF